MSLVSLTLLALLGTVSLATAATLIRNEADALAYVDATFSANNCVMSQAAFFDGMVVDGVAPGAIDMTQPQIGTDKIIRQRRILTVLEDLFAAGKLREDANDPRNAISSFGGCA